MLEPLLARIDRWEHLGVHRDKRGSRLVGHTPRDFPDAYLHTVVAPLKASDWKSYGVELPPHLKEVYSECNGLHLFGTSLCVYGIRSHFRRDASAAFEPFDLLRHSEESRTVHHPLKGNHADERVFFAGYDWDNSHAYTLPDDGTVYFCEAGSAEATVKWPSVMDYLLSEYDRIAKLYDEEGYPIDEMAPTTPSP